MSSFDHINSENPSEEIEVKTTVTNSMKSSGKAEDEEPNFDRDIHILTPLPSAEQQGTFEEMKNQLRSHELFQKYQSWATDRQLIRFLVARNYNLEASLKLIIEALEWRNKRKPHEILENMSEWDEKLSKESETGKIYCPGTDRWGRSIVVFNNDVQNTRNAEDHMNFLAWNLEFASSLMNEEVSDKYVIFCHLTQFSLFSAPAFSETLETIHMLTGCFPERLGHFICYQAPVYFRTVFATIRSFLDQKTVNKLVFVSGDTSEGSKNDILMKHILGNDWKLLSGVEQPLYGPNCSPGFNHKTYWPTVHERIEIIKSRSSSKNNSAKHSAPPENDDPVDEKLVESLDGLII